MALTTGAQAASATPATDLYNTIAGLLTAAGWTHIATKTAATMGTTAAVEVWCTPATTVAANVYTGCIVYLEVDNANARIRVRASEMFDNGAAGTPATNVKWQVPGFASSYSQAPTSDFHQTGIYLALFQATADAQLIGWSEIACGAGGFNYWLGADANRVLIATQSGGFSHWTVAGALEYLGAPGSGGTGAVFIATRMVGSHTCASWTYSTGSGSSTTAKMGNVRCSREPNSVANVLGNWCFFTGPSWPSLSDSPEVYDATDVGGSIVANHQFHSVLVASPCFIHGARQGSFVGRRSHLAKMSDFVCFSGNTEPTIGDTLTIAGATYLILGPAGSLMGSSSFDVRFNLAVRQAAF